MTEKIENIPNFEAISILSMFLQFDRITIESEIDSFKEYIIDNRNNIKKLQDSFNLMIEEQKKKYPDNIEDLYESYESQYYNYLEFYPATFNNSTLLSLYSLFEFNFKNLCITLQNNAQFKIKLEDINGQGHIDISRKYINLVAGIDLTELEATWQKIIVYQQLRNCIVHNNSSILKKKNQDIKNIKTLDIYKEIKKNPNLKINEGNGTFIISNDQFLLDFLDLIEKYLLSILKKLEGQNK